LEAGSCNFQRTAEISDKGDYPCSEFQICPQIPQNGGFFKAQSSVLYWKKIYRQAEIQEEKSPCVPCRDASVSVLSV